MGQIFEVTNTLSNINFSPASGLEEIAQNVQTIISTVQETVPLYRDFGIDPDMIDQPLNESIKNKIVLQIVDRVNRYEPRVRVRDVSFSGNTLDGELKVTVQVEVIET